MEHRQEWALYILKLKHDIKIIKYYLKFTKNSHGGVDFLKEIKYANWIDDS